MAKDIFLTKSIIFMVIYILSVIYLFIFINFDKSFTKIVETLLLINYSNRLYPLLLENYIRKETSIAAFAAPIYKICNIEAYHDHDRFFVLCGYDNFIEYSADYEHLSQWLTLPFDL